MLQCVQKKQAWPVSIGSHTTKSAGLKTTRWQIAQLKGDFICMESINVYEAATMTISGIPMHNHAARGYSFELPVAVSYLHASYGRLEAIYDAHTFIKCVRSIITAKERSCMC